jgi:N-ethylmaleimide reductase
MLVSSAITADGEMYTDAKGMTLDDIIRTQKEFFMAAENTIAASFYGVESHAENGYLLEQFIRPNANIRNDQYDGTIANRARFVLEVTARRVAAIGKAKVGIGLSPFGVFNDMPLYGAMASDYAYLTEELNALGLLYLHIVDHCSMGAPIVPDSMK